MGPLLDGTNLDGTNLNGANLDGANLDGANLNGANLALVANPPLGSVPSERPEGDNRFIDSPFRIDPPWKKVQAFWMIARVTSIGWQNLVF
ncbi:pentapeptide repeat-containing protein [Roseimaritima multifibrata]|uniref:pentapeptide repeat-containing protein n=1 Tax=Roseimaritima multifibrata TaxID=1930274 RepID=UPI0037047D57